jgi:two-component system, response regulator RegA
MLAVPHVGGPRTILVVDDDEGTRTGLKLLLEGAGYRVIACGSFTDGRIALSAAAPDLLITDIRLGEFNGLQLVATNPWPIPTIVLTGFPDPVLEADARQLGAEFVVKPITPSAFIRIIERKLRSLPASPDGEGSGRRWRRKHVTTDVCVRIDKQPVRLLDVSYGGVRFELERQPDRILPRSFKFELPESGVSVSADLVWATRNGDHLVCGAALHQDQVDADAWRAAVDTIS